MIVSMDSQTIQSKKRKKINDIESPQLSQLIMNGIKINNNTCRTRHNPFKLIPCESFASQTEAPFLVKLSIECLAIVDIHAHYATTEVIGLLGGTFCKQTSQLFILTAEPCLTIADHNLQCEMEPVSQAMANERLSSKGYSCVGWYHSHPTFVPNPSLRDLETQSRYQQLFSAECDKPFIALILSPYSTISEPLAKNTLVSKFKIITVGHDDNNNSGVDESSSSPECHHHQCHQQRVPYELTAQLIRREKLMFSVTTKLKELCLKMREKPTAVPMNDKIRKFRGGEITYSQKLFASLKYYLKLTGLSHVETNFLLDQCRAIITEECLNIKVQSSKAKKRHYLIKEHLQ